MGFMNSIVAYLATIRNWFLQSYYTVNSWVWPFNNLATPLLYIYDAFAWLTIRFGEFNTWLTWAANKISQILDISAITSYFQTWINYATSAYNWIVSALSNVTNIISSWWNTAQATVKVWIDQAKQWALVQTNNLAGTLAPVLAWWNNFLANLPTLSEILLWFTNWWANILNKLSLWWNERLLDIKSLFNSWALELAPVWAGWQEIRETVFDFFSDPLEWLWTKFTDWFLGAE